VGAAKEGFDQIELAISIVISAQAGIHRPLDPRFRARGYTYFYGGADHVKPLSRRAGEGLIVIGGGAKIVCINLRFREE
jgi:hypothetical protein